MAEQEVCEIISDAINILETEGWGREAYYSKGKGYCAVGAIYKAAGYVDHARPEPNQYNKYPIDLALEIVSQSLPKSAQNRNNSAWGNITEYNDSVKTKTPIIKLFKRALENCK